MLFSSGNGIGFKNVANISYLPMIRIRMFPIVISAGNLCIAGILWKNSLEPTWIWKQKKDGMSIKMKIHRNQKNRMVLLLETVAEEKALQTFLTGNQSGFSEIAITALDMAEQIMEFLK